MFVLEKDSGIIPSVLTQILDSCVNGVTLADPDLEDSPIVYANKAFGDMTGYAQEGLAIMKGWMEKHAKEMESFASFPTGYLGMVTEDNALALYEGELRMVDAQRRPIERFDGRHYLDYIAEHVEDWSYLKISCITYVVLTYVYL